MVETSAPRPSRRSGNRLGRAEWVAAALEALADGGLGAVAVEPVAARLGATKGSFYWHFANRDELVVAVLAEWERRRTDEVIAAVEESAAIEAGAAPGIRLRALFHRVFAGTRTGAVDAALLADAGSPLVAPVLDRVTRRRLAYLERCYGEFGLDAAEAHRWAVLAYTTYLGLFSLRRAAPDVVSDEGLLASLEPLLSPSLGGPATATSPEERRSR